MSRTRTNPDYLNGVPELLILHLLSRRPMYGYEIVRAIEESTEQALEFGEGCIYPVLHRLEAGGSLASRRELVGGRSRVVYRVTPAGKKKLVQSENHWRAIVAAVEKVLRGEEHERPALA
ncbi:MAG: PadR family transcriptional regulator [Planctomycetota bacterium]